MAAHQHGMACSVGYVCRSACLPVGLDQVEVPQRVERIHFQLIVVVIVAIRVQEHLKVIVVCNLQVMWTQICAA